MSDGLFSAFELEQPADDGGAGAGYRLAGVEVYNWGTFDRLVWSFAPDGRTSLLTGDIGSGKSTLVDAITTLLLPANRISYNKAAGADSKERSLRSYVEGHHRSERNETTGASRPVGLRDHHSYSVILGRFVNEGYDEIVTIAQVFHQKDRAGQPDRFFVTAPTGLSITPDFADFGSDLRTLRKRLRDRGAEVDNTFPEYHKRLRRLLGIRSEQAMDLFHQTVSMKSVGNLNDFVRNHMLESVDAQERIREIVTHFENLVRAHDAVRTATEQLSVLTPLIAAADRYDQVDAKKARAIRERDAVAPYIATRVVDLLGTEIARQGQEYVRLEGEAEDIDSRRQKLLDERDDLRLRRAGLGGDRLKLLENEIPRAAQERERKTERSRAFASHLDAAGLDPVDDESQFRARSAEIRAVSADLLSSRAGLGDRQHALLEQRAVTRPERARVADELVSLEGRRNSLPLDLDAVRVRLCAALGITEVDVPFAAELIDIRPEYADWHGAAERVLRGFGLSLLVSQQLYPAVSQWINDNRLGTRLVYLRVAERRVRSAPIASSSTRLIDAVTVESGPFHDYISAELSQRADHVLAESVQELQRQDRAVTREGLIRDRDRHEKDDRRDATDPRKWILGRGREQKIAALREEQERLDVRLAQLERELHALDEELDDLARRGAALTALGEYPNWHDLDARAAAELLVSLTAERDQLVAGSSELAALDGRIAEVETAAAEWAERRQTLDRARGTVEAFLRAYNDRHALETRTLANLDSGVLEAASGFFDSLDSRAGSAAPDTPEALDRLGEELTRQLTRAIEQAQSESNGYTTDIQRQMNDFLRRWPGLKAELDASVQAIPEFRRLHSQVLDDDLPRFESEFRLQLNTNAVRDLAGFNNWLRRQAEEIRARVATINEALSAIEYSPGRIIVLVAEQTPNTEIATFRRDLRDAGGDALADDAAVDAEARFERIRLLLERFAGRTNHADADRQWTRRVTDVRNWFTFAASEQDKVNGAEFEHYTDSDGKSGGQKEKLAYTILAASLAYQFGLKWGAEKSKDFRFAVIDEAFGRGSDASTRYALDLFAKLGLQLLIVTPLQKVNVIEPYVRTIGFVDNPTGAASRVHSLTIEEFHERRRAGSS